MDRKKLINLIQLDKDIVAAILFGSESLGTASVDSDIGIALLYASNHIPNPISVLGFRQQISDEMRQDVDIVLLNKASPIIAMQAIKNGVPLLIRDQKVYDAYEVQLITDYADVKHMREPFEKNILKRKLHD